MTLIATDEDMMPVQVSSLGTGLLWGLLVFVSTANLLQEGFYLALPGLTGPALCMSLAALAATVSAIAAATRHWDAAAGGLFLMTLSML